MSVPRHRRTSESGGSLIGTLIGIAVMATAVALFAAGMARIMKSSHEVSLSGEYDQVIASVRTGLKQSFRSMFEDAPQSVLCSTSTLKNRYDSWDTAYPSTLLKLSVTDQFLDARLADLADRCDGSAQTHTGAGVSWQNRSEVFLCSTVQDKGAYAQTSDALEDTQFHVEALIQLVDLATDKAADCGDLYDSSTVDSPAFRLLGRLVWIDDRDGPQESQRVRSLPFVDFSALDLDRDD